MGLERGFVGFRRVYSRNEDVFRKKIEIVGLWEYKGNEGEEGNRLLRAPFLHKHMAKLVFGPPNAEVCTRANNPSYTSLASIDDLVVVIWHFGREQLGTGISPEILG